MWRLVFLEIFINRNYILGVTQEGDIVFFFCFKIFQIFFGFGVILNPKFVVLKWLSSTTLFQGVAFCFLQFLLTARMFSKFLSLDLCINLPSIAAHFGF